MKVRRLGRAPWICFTLLSSAKMTASTHPMSLKSTFLMMDLIHPGVARSMSA